MCQIKQNLVNNKMTIIKNQNGRGKFGLVSLFNGLSTLVVYLMPKYLFWIELPQALASMSIHTKQNICALIKQATFPH